MSVPTMMVAESAGPLTCNAGNRGRRGQQGGQYPPDIKVGRRGGPRLLEHYLIGIAAVIRQSG